MVERFIQPHMRNEAPQAVDFRASPTEADRGERASRCGTSRAPFSLKACCRFRSSAVPSPIPSLAQGMQTILGEGAYSSSSRTPRGLAAGPCDGDAGAPFQDAETHGAYVCERCKRPADPKCFTTCICQVCNWRVLQKIKSVRKPASYSTD